MSKQTAVEWLVDQFKEYDFSEDDGMYLIKIPSWLLTEKEDQAKQMEKEQIEEAYVDGQTISNAYQGASDYYNTEYGDEN
jgi:hypothetical protein